MTRQQSIADIEGFEPSFLWGDNPNPTRQLSTYVQLRSYRDSNPPSSSNACLLSELFQTVYIGYPIYSGYLFIRPLAVLMGLEPTTPCVTGRYSNQTELQHQISNTSKNHSIFHKKTRLFLGVGFFFLKKGGCI